MYNFSTLVDGYHILFQPLHYHYAFHFSFQLLYIFEHGHDPILGI